MDLVAGAMSNVASKLLRLLQDEYKLQKGTKAQVETLANELQGIHVALCKVAKVPYDQLDLQVKLWASEAREAFYDMEDSLDNFLVRVDGCHLPTDADKSKVHLLLDKIKISFSRFKARREIAGAIEDIQKQVDEMTKRRDRYKVDDNSPTRTSIDPRALISHRKVSELVGIDEPRDALIRMLHMGDDDKSSGKEMKVVSIVGSGGLGKTTLAKVVYEKLTVDMNIPCKAFVSVGQNPDLKKVFRDILRDLDNEQYKKTINYFTTLEEGQLSKEIKDFLKTKRYFVVIDDVWEVQKWNVIRLALEDNEMGSKIMMTTRHSDVAELCHCTYKIKPLCPKSSKILFHGRIFGSQDQCPERFIELSDKILKKCDGVPLAIIIIASLLANKPDDITEWNEVCNSIGSGLSSSNDMYNNMRKILSLSYYDLPPHMKTCFLYLSMYPEDYEIKRDQLIWRWICEGFIQPQTKGDDLFELGKSYFNDLINRSLIQPSVGIYDEIDKCRVHDMILDLICFLSREENFVTTSDDIEKGMLSESRKFRRLSLKTTSTRPTKGVSQVRTIVVFGSSFESMPYLSCFDMLRVLDLQGCSVADYGGSKLCIGNLVHLRYLYLRTRPGQLIGGMEKLHFLQVLKIFGSETGLESIYGLRQLMCLEGYFHCPRKGNLLRNLVSLQVLSALYVGKDSADTLEALGHLTQLTQLKIFIEPEMVEDRSICNTFIDSLNNLRRLQSLEVYGSIGLIRCWERWSPSPHLRKLEFSNTCSRALLKWISPALPTHLVWLQIHVHTVGPEDIQILGTLPNLVVLEVRADYKNSLKQPLQKSVVSADAFPRLRSCELLNVVIVPSMFTWGAMPWVQEFWFLIRARDFFSNHAQPELGFDDLAMDHLPSLQIVHCTIQAGDIASEEVGKLYNAVKHAADVHPNHPSLQLRM